MTNCIYCNEPIRKNQKAVKRVLELDYPEGKRRIVHQHLRCTHTKDLDYLYEEQMKRR